MAIGFETRSVRMEPVSLIEVQAPLADVERIMAAVVAVDPLAMGADYDQNTFQSALGIERYRPREGATAGAEAGVRQQRPGVVRLTFETAGGRNVLAAIVEAVFQVHSYQAPVIRITACLSARDKGLDNSANPYRWWNTDGDWKDKA